MGIEGIILCGALSGVAVGFYMNSLPLAVLVTIVLGAILGLGLDREKVGDLLVADGRCDVLALEEVADFLVFHMEQAGRVKLKCSPLPLDRLEPRRWRPEPSGTP